MGRQRAMPLYKITRVCFRGRCNFSCFQSSFLLFPFLPFLSLFLVWSWTLRMCSTRDFLEVLVPFFLLFICHCWRFLLVLECLWTRRPWKAMGRQRAMPLYKITRGDPWDYHVSVCFRGRCNFSCFQSSFLLFPFLPFLSLFLVWSWTLRMCSTRDFLEVLVPFFRLFTSLSAIPEDSCWFWTVCGHRDHVRPCRQRAMPLYKITRGDPWGYHVSVCFRGPGQIRTAKPR